ncbi:MAG: 2-C-methyl-D-erythritol 4-phosphate cytidylyltransferase [Bacteroidales bacterium]|nr:2-C-methyl-D-erythritol 4-phosphate cytidylyltransferase [Bacteroidales bacterium]
MRNIAVILAGGTGSRMGGPLPKQFLACKGRLLIEYAVDAFDKHALVDEVAVVVHPDYMDYMEKVVRRNGWIKVRQLLEGGSERYLSSLSAIRAYEGETELNLLLHDAARPWISGETIKRVVEALYTHEAVGVAIPSTDTVWEVEDGSVCVIPDRRRMWLAQTPQAFRLPLVAEAYSRAMQDPDFMATDDCGVVRKYMPEVEIHVVEGDKGNTKITYAEDIVS